MGLISSCTSWMSLEESLLSVEAVENCQIWALGLVKHSAILQLYIRQVCLLKRACS